MDLGPRVDGAPASGPVARNVVLRPDVLDQLDCVTTQLVTLVCAPAGYGKSLAVASWLRDRGHDAAWTTLRPATIDAVGLWKTVIDALIASAPADAAALKTIRDVVALVPDETPAALASWIAGRGAPTILVIDDLHQIAQPETYAQILELVGAAGTGLHLVAITRHEPPWPLHRMRLDGILDQIGLDQLQFSEESAAELFHSLGLPMSRDDVALLTSRTEGWAAGLRLAAIGLREAPDRHEFAVTLSGRGGHIADYLIREISSRIPPLWHEFLNRICVVDEVSPNLAVALGGGPDSGALLERMAGANAFVYQVGTTGRYRLHPLLLDFLRSRRTPAQLAEMHSVAARWYVDNDQPLTALTHLTAGGEWATAGDLMVRHVASWTVCRSPIDFAALLEPIPREALLIEPGLAAGVAAARTMSGVADGVDELVEAAKAGIPRTVGAYRRRLKLLLDLVELGRRRWAGDLQSVLDASLEIPYSPAELAELGFTDWASMRNLLIANEGLCRLWLGEHDAADATLRSAVSDDLGRPIVLPILNARAHLALLQWSRGELTSAKELAEDVTDQGGAAGLTHSAQLAAAYTALAGVAFDRDFHDEADRWLDLASSAVAEPHLSFAVAVLRARLEWVPGRPRRCPFHPRGCPRRDPTHLHAAAADRRRRSVLHRAGGHRCAHPTQPPARSRAQPRTDPRRTTRLTPAPGRPTPHRR